MAIDLCKTMEQVQVADDQAILASQFGDTLESISVSLDALSPQQREVVELAYRSALTHPNPLAHVIGDPAAWESNFSHVLDRVAVRLDPRPSAELRHQALNHPDPVMREQALYEYADRNEKDAIELLCQAVRQDRDREVRWDALWAIDKLGGIEAIQALREFQTADDPAIAEWAGLFIGELQTGHPVFDARECASTPGRTFDETIHLLIHADLYIRLDGTNQRWGKLSLTPQLCSSLWTSARLSECQITRTAVGHRQDYCRPARMAARTSTTTSSVVSPSARAMIEGLLF